MVRKNKSKEKKVNAFLIIALVVFLASLLLLLFVLFRNSVFILEKMEIPIKVIISNRTAYNITRGSPDFHLGSVKEGYSAVRKFDAINTYPFGVKYEFEVVGNITPLIVYPEYAYLASNQTMEIPFSTEIISNETEWGQYEGTIYVTIKRFFGEILEESSEKSNE